MSCDNLTPVSAFQNTNLNNKMDSFDKLAQRIVRTLGAPLISVEISRDQLFDAISQACEFFSKYAGYTKEYLVIDSSLYERGRGLPIDKLYTLANGNISPQNKVAHRTQSRDTAPYVKNEDTFYISASALNKAFFSINSELSGLFVDGLERNVILDYSTYNKVVTAFAADPTLNVIPISTYFVPSYSQTISMQGTVDENQPTVIYNNMFDYDAMDYRKVIAVTDFQEGASTGINTLFTIEQTLAQQTYFSYAMGNYGFDLVSWYTVKQWLDTREKVLATKRSFEFDDRTQILRIYPEPSNSVRFYGVIYCYVERPIRDLIKEMWVYQYALALSKITVGMVRGKFSGVNLFGGQVFTNDLMQQGLTEKEKLETQLYTTAAGLGDSDPCIFMVS
jgi:hypothetical protein